MEREWAQERAAFDKHSEEVARNLADVKARIASLQQVQERAITVADNWTRTVRQHERNMAPFGALQGRSVLNVNQAEVEAARLPWRTRLLRRLRSR